MDILRINNRRLVPVRLVPFVTGWNFPPDRLVLMLAHKDNLHNICLSSSHLSSDGSIQPMLPKEWDVICTALCVLTESLKSKEKIKNENYLQWREQSIVALPSGTFIWLADLDWAWDTAYSEENIMLTNERKGDRELNLQPYLSKEVLSLIFEGFEGLVGPLAESVSSEAAILSNSSSDKKHDALDSDHDPSTPGAYLTKLIRLATQAVRDYPAWRSGQRKVQKTGNLQDWLTKHIGANHREAEILKKILSENFQELN